MNTPVPQNVCLVRDLWMYGVRLDSVVGRMQFLQFLSMAADQMDAVKVSFLNKHWGLLHFHSHELRSHLSYLCAADTVASLSALILEVQNNPAVFAMLPFVDAADRAFGLYQKWMVAYVWKLEANAKITDL